MRIALLHPIAPTLSTTHCCAMLHAASGCRYQIFTSAQRLLAATATGVFDCLLIEGLAYGNRLLEIVRTLTQRAATIPILVLLPPMPLTTHATAAMIALLDAGVDDCLLEPVDTALLLARIRAMTRRSHPHLSGHVGRTRFGRYCFDPVHGIVEFDGEAVALTPKELTLALTLFRHLGRELPRAYLIEGAWLRESASTSRSLDTHISRIRHKLRLVPTYGYHLVALYSQGYRLDRLREFDASAPPYADTSLPTTPQAREISPTSPLPLNNHIAFVPLPPHDPPVVVDTLPFCPLSITRAPLLA